MNAWYEKLGFGSNPFSIKPAAFHDELISYDLGVIYKKIDDGEMVFIDGQYGTGKTTILKNIINRYRGDGRVIYYNFNRHDKEFDAKELLTGANPLVKRVFGMMPKNIIMLLDEVQKIKVAEGKRILKYYNEGNIKSVIFVNNDYYSTVLPDFLEEKLKGNVIRTRSLSGSEAVDLIRKRIGNLEILSDRTIMTIFKRSGSNPRKFLENCEDICKVAIENGDSEVTKAHIDMVLGKEKKETDKAPSEKTAPKAEAVSAKKAEKPAEMIEEEAEERVEAQKKPAAAKEKAEAKADKKPEPKQKRPAKQKPMPEEDMDDDDDVDFPDHEFEFLKDEVEVIDLESKGGKKGSR